MEDLDASSTCRSGTTPTAGTILKQPNLARTFRMIVEGGMDAFYKGEIGKEIVRFSEENGGLITQKDLDDFHPGMGRADRRQLSRLRCLLPAAAVQRHPVSA